MNNLRLAGLLVSLGLGLLLGGCASYDVEVERGHSVAGLQRYFVVSNLNDNHGLDRQIVATLKARGLAAEAGPLTMMPIGTQAILTYEDRWDWDFGDHLLYLRLTAHENRMSNQFLGAVNFSARIPVHETTAVTVGKLIDRLIPAKH